MDRKRAVCVGLIACAFALAVSSAGSVQASPFRNLRPGEAPALSERILVNIVFVGIDRKRIDTADFEDALPASSRPILRGATFVRGGKPQYLGLRYAYDYRIHFASTSYADSFFGNLRKASKPAPLTRWQLSYNAQRGQRDIDANQTIDAPSVERWLAAHPPRGIDTTKNTLFLIDWHSRKDFRHHVYTKDHEADSGFEPIVDTQQPDQDKFIAWGGTASDDPEDGRGIIRRVWFYDLSAGPDYWSRNSDVTTTDRRPFGRPLDEDRTIPPSWEYVEGGYRSPELLTGDLADLTRFVAIDLLFTPSPLFPALMTARGRPTSVNVDMNFYDTPATSALDQGSAGVMVRTLRKLAPWLRFSADIDAADFTYPEHLNCFVQWSTLPQMGGGPACYPDDRYGADANLVLFHSRNRARFFEGGSDYEAGAFTYQAPGGPDACYAFADDDRLTGAQSFVFAFLQPGCVPAWTDILIHEFGHHVGLSHPHDGYDFEQNQHIFPIGIFAFAFVGTEVNSAMAYHFRNNEFSQFDADNMARWATEAYVSSANALASELLAAEVPARTMRRSDDLVGTASAALTGHRYRDAVDAARRAYIGLATLARQAGVSLDARAPSAPRPAGPVSAGRGEIASATLDRVCGLAFCR